MADSNNDAISNPADTTFTTLKNGVLSVLDTELSALYFNSLSDTTAMSVLAAGLAAPATDSGTPQYVVIDATAKDGDGAALLTALTAIGLQQGGSFGSMASGVLPVASIASLLTLSDLSFARESGAISSGGSVTNQADVSVHADTARSTYGVDGSGLKVGVLSDSFNNLGGMSGDITSGDLPSDTTILSDLSSGGTDEGRAMAQIVNDIAPGASILFATAATGEANFANNIIALAHAGAKIIVDDYGYFDEPAYQDGPIAQAVDQVTAMGVLYFVAVGNDGNNGYEAPFVASGMTDATYHESLAQLTTGAHSQFLSVNVPTGVTVYFTLKWDQPYESVSGGAGSQSDLDLFLYNVAGTRILKQAISDNIGHDPVEIIKFTNNNANQTTFNLAVGLASGAAPGDFKLMALDDGAGVTLETSSLNINTSTLYGHAMADGAIAVAAADYVHTPAFGSTRPLVETWSTPGPDTVLFDTAGNLLATPEVRDGPQFTAPDGGDTTFFGWDSDNDGLPNFFGTSAATPAAGAVAALMLEANNALNRDDIINLLKDSAIDMDNPATPGFDKGVDFATGAGLIQADKAVGFAKTLDITGDSHNNTLLGTHLADTIIGGHGADTMAGGAGDDTYYVDSPGDVVTELAGAANGFDTVLSRVDYSLTAGSAVEVLRGDLGLKGLHLTGNTLDNDIYGRAGDDTLNGGGGDDRLAGGAGDDTYIVNNAGVKIVELANGGTDTVKSSVSITLANNVENLTLTGSNAINGTGNNLDNVIQGNGADNVLRGEGGNDILIGGAGADKLYGGSGADIFKFGGQPGQPSTGDDQIRDFSGVTEQGEGDRIDLTGVESAAGVHFTPEIDGLFHGGAGELRWYISSGGNTVVQVDFDGDRHTDFGLLLTGVHNLSHADFIL